MRFFDAEKKRPKTHEEPLSVILQYLIVYVSSSKYTPTHTIPRSSLAIPKMIVTELFS